MDNQNINSNTINAIFEKYPDVVTVKDLQTMLRISRQVAYQLIKDEKIPSRKIGRIYRIRKADVIAFLQ